MGYSGSGKSTFAKYLSEKYNIPLLYLDKVHWLTNWVENNSEDELKQVEEFLDNNTSWVIDGNYSSLLLDRRLKEADKIYLFLFNRFTCLYRCYKRNKYYKNVNRDSMTSGCIEKLDKEFISWILKDGRSNKIKDRYKQIKNTYKDKVIVIRNQRELTAIKK